MFAAAKGVSFDLSFLVTFCVDGARGSTLNCQVSFSVKCADTRHLTVTDRTCL